MQIKSVHLQAKIVRRSAGRSVIAAAAYRRGDRLTDRATGEVHDFTRKRGIRRCGILAPPEAAEAPWRGDHEALWNTVERTEKRRDAQLARELEIALPDELSHQQREDLLWGFCEREFVGRGMVADVSIHAGHPGDSANCHAHVLLCMRRWDGSSFGPKVRDWNSPALLDHWKAEWEVACNAALEAAGVAVRFDRRSINARMEAALVRAVESDAAGDWVEAEEARIEAAVLGYTPRPNIGRAAWKAIQSGRADDPRFAERIAAWEASVASKTAAEATARAMRAALDARIEEEARTTRRARVDAVCKALAVLRETPPALEAYPEALRPEVTRARALMASPERGRDAGALRRDGALGVFTVSGAAYALAVCEVGRVAGARTLEAARAAFADHLADLGLVRRSSHDGRFRVAHPAGVYAQGDLSLLNAAFGPLDDVGGPEPAPPAHDPEPDVDEELDEHRCWMGRQWCRWRVRSRGLEHERARAAVAAEDAIDTRAAEAAMQDASRPDENSPAPSLEPGDIRTVVEATPSLELVPGTGPEPSRTPADGPPADAEVVAAVDACDAALDRHDAVLDDLDRAHREEAQLRHAFAGASGAPKARRHWSPARFEPGAEDAFVRDAGDPEEVESGRLRRWWLADLRGCAEDLERVSEKLADAAPNPDAPLYCDIGDDVLREVRPSLDWVRAGRAAVERLGAAHPLAREITRGWIDVLGRHMPLLRRIPDLLRERVEAMAGAIGRVRDRVAGLRDELRERESRRPAPPTPAAQEASPRPDPEPVPVPAPRPTPEPAPTPNSAAERDCRRTESRARALDGLEPLVEAEGGLGALLGRVWRRPMTATELGRRTAALACAVEHLRRLWSEDAPEAALRGAETAYRDAVAPLNRARLADVAALDSDARAREFGRLAVLADLQDDDGLLDPVLAPVRLETLRALVPDARAAQWDFQNRIDVYRRTHARQVAETGEGLSDRASSADRARACQAVRDLLADPTRLRTPSYTTVEAEAAIGAAKADRGIDLRKPPHLGTLGEHLDRLAALADRVANSIAPELVELRGRIARARKDAAWARDAFLADPVAWRTTVWRVADARQSQMEEEIDERARMVREDAARRHRERAAAEQAERQWLARSETKERAEAESLRHRESAEDALPRRTRRPTEDPRSGREPTSPPRSRPSSDPTPGR